MRYLHGEQWYLKRTLHCLKAITPVTHLIQPEFGQPDQ